MVRRRKLSPWGFIGMGALACQLFLDLATTTIAPWWVTTLMLLLWLACFLTATRWFEPHPTRVPWLFVLCFAVWLPTISLGTRLLGWR